MLVTSTSTFSNEKIKVLYKQLQRVLTDYYHTHILFIKI